MLRSEAAKKKIVLPSWSMQYINLQQVFYQAYSKYGARQNCNLKFMLKYLGLDLCGRHHSGIDDCMNIASIVCTMIQQGHSFSTHQITNIPSGYNPDHDMSIRDFNMTRKPEFVGADDAVLTSNFIKIKGLPWGHTIGDVAQFFAGLRIKGYANGITLCVDEQNKPTGAAIVEFESSEHAREALKRHKSYIRHRYIDVCPCTDAEIPKRSPQTAI
jgi:RNA recognition motif-containing protein